MIFISKEERSYLYWYLYNSKKNATGTYDTESSRAIDKILDALKKGEEILIK